MFDSCNVSFLAMVFISWSSYANWRYHVLEVYMKCGDDKGALKFAGNESNKDAFTLASSVCAWLWSVALLNYRLNKHRGFAEEYFASLESETQQSYAEKCIESAVLRAIQSAPVVLEFLTNERRLPKCHVPCVMGNESSLTNAATYCLSNKKLWENTPGAIEWACENARTFFCIVMLHQDEEACQRLKIVNSVAFFKGLVEKGIFVNGGVAGGKKLVHDAVSSGQTEYLKILLNAGANAAPKLKPGVPQPLHIACYYNFDPEIIRLLCCAGMSQ